MNNELSFAFKRTIPVLFGYLFLGIAFGLLLQDAGYNFAWAAAASTFVYAGSMQFALVGLLADGAGLITVAIMTLSINSRHLFYGISFVERFKSMGKLRPYMIFSLTDETYSLLCSTTVPTDLDENKTIFYIAVLDQIYWIIGSISGALIGKFIPLNTEGIEFAMTALFVVIFLDQWKSMKNHLPALIGAACGIAALVIVGPDKFILPALITAAAALLLLQGIKPAGKGAQS